MGSRPIGVLALQGDFHKHADALARHGRRVRPVRRPSDLEALGAVVLPGGESTTMLKLLRSEGLFAPLRAAIADGLPVLATCAGMVLLARGVEPEQESYGLLDIDVERNGYGRQIASGVFDLDGGAGRGVFIRAPRVTRIGRGVEVLARRAGEPVLVRQGAIVAASFHPELARSHPVVRSFAAA